MNMVKHGILYGLVIVASALLGCAGSRHATHGGSTVASAGHATGCGAGAIHDASLVAAAEAEGREVALAGATGCPHCDLRARGAPGGCCLGLRTEDGTLYKLLHSDVEDRLTATLRSPGATVNVRGKHLARDGQNYLLVTAFEVSGT